MNRIFTLTKARKKRSYGFSSFKELIFFLFVSSLNASFSSNEIKCNEKKHIEYIYKRIHILAQNYYIVLDGNEDMHSHCVRNLTFSFSRHRPLSLSLRFRCAPTVYHVFTIRGTVVSLFVDQASNRQKTELLVSISLENNKPKLLHKLNRFYYALLLILVSKEKTSTRKQYCLVVTGPTHTADRVLVSCTYYWYFIYY